MHAVLNKSVYERLFLKNPPLYATLFFFKEIYFLNKITAQLNKTKQQFLMSCSDCYAINLKPVISYPC